ncbi:hypothetical protein HY947_05755 [Candidatus Gottesmanbacteria bacterium]|nr:hypothetical protein [Candidatus Gottesmanbacteria bacterium]
MAVDIQPGEYSPKSFFARAQPLGYRGGDITQIKEFPLTRQEAVPLITQLLKNIAKKNAPPELPVVPVVAK